MTIRYREAEEGEEGYIERRDMLKCLGLSAVVLATVRGALGGIMYLTEERDDITSKPTTLDVNTVSLTPPEQE
ncbi:hypothetical protein HYZ98_04685 [Candidatus Peregrinibacteria bacterium]|nr:hypothetical protein [Candidatus Peregrinibacteria bacterium]